MAKARTSAPKKAPRERKTQELAEYAYTITDANFPDFNVKNSANGWWLEKEKVAKLIDAYKIDANDKQACFYAGISYKQLEYFIELHPEFCEIREVCKESLMLTIQQQIANEAAKNPAAAMAYKKHKDELAARRESDRMKREAALPQQGDQPPNEITFVDFSEPEQIEHAENQ